MVERLQRVIDILELVEVRRTQNHKLLAAAVEGLRAIQSEIETNDQGGESGAK